MRLFFYGTLMDPEVCRLVFGGRFQDMRSQPAVLLGYRRVRAVNGNFPVLVPGRGRRLEGLLVENLPPEILLAIAHYEGPDYEPRQGAVIDRSGRRLRAWIFMPRYRRVASSRPWNFERWQKRGRARLRPQLQHWMLEFGALTLQSIDTPWHVKRRIRELCRDPANSSR